MTFGIIGLGSIGERHARNIRSLFPGADIHVLTKRRTFDGIRNIRLENDAKKFFSEKHDIYFVTNETAKHTGTILQCLKQKPRGIFVEKPLALNVEEGEKLCRLADHRIKRIQCPRL